MARNRTQFTAAAGLFESRETTAPAITPNPSETALKTPTEGVRGTQGRKGAKSRRMNVPVTDEEYEAIRRGSRAAGLTYGEYIYTAVLYYQKNHKLDD